ncbi:unnamed protein product [Peronospora belbahrii]|uniref:Nucleoporin NSP1-like C-terminal domain-containing protein n=1 Tax=Peronospora belbahrii TaxID=622444 RepID=A0ABN8D0P6_9STRA|nr:unnamed protein product [Peronospora belbahrii]
MTESSRKLALEELHHPPLWPLSGFAIAKGLPSLVMGDVSCEESRWEAYQEKKITGNCIQSIQKFQALAAEQQNQRQRVVALLENRESAQKLFNGEMCFEAKSVGAANPFGGGGKTADTRFGGTAAPFGGPTTAGNPFGNAGGGGATLSSSLFGTPSTSAANPFTGGTNSTLFGGAAANPFGGGSSTTTFQTPSGVGTGGSAGVFGNAAAPSSPSPFGNPVTPAANLFGTPSVSGFEASSTSQFGGAVSATASPFGNGTLAPTAFSNGVTGCGLVRIGGDAAKPASSPFVSGTATPSSSPFGVPSVTPPFNGISEATSISNTFGNTASSNNATTFGESSSGFGSPFGNITGATNPFTASASSSTTTPSSFVTSSRSPFDASTAPTSAPSVAGVSSVSTTTAPLAAPISSPSPDARDDNWNTEQFRQPQFSLGMVPTVPPPPQFC